MRQSSDRAKWDKITIELRSGGMENESGRSIVVNYSSRRQMAAKKETAHPLILPVTLSNEKAISVIGDFLTGEWASLTPDDITVTRLRGGFMNTIHKVERTDRMNCKEPNVLIIRSSGAERSAAQHDPAVREEIMKLTEAEEVLIFNEMTKRKQCPRLIGLIEKGRVEEFRSMHCILPQEVLMPQYMQDIAKAFARMHTLDLPLGKKRWTPFWKRAAAGYPKRTTQKWLKALAHELGIECVATTIDYGEEVEWLIKVQEKYYDRRSRRALIQADTHYLNLVVNEHPRQGELNVWLLDYELCSYGPRGLDLGAHFLNRQMLWGDDNLQHAYISGLEQHTHEERIAFLRFYRDELRRLHLDDFDENGVDSIDNLLFESYVGALLYHCFFNYIAFFRYTEEQARNAQGGESMVRITHAFSSAYLEAKRRAIEKYPFLDPSVIG